MSTATGLRFQIRSDLSHASGTSGLGVFGKLEDLPDDQMSGVVDDVTIQFQNFVGPAGIVQGVSGDGSQCIVLVNLVDWPGHRITTDAAFGFFIMRIPTRPAWRSIASAGWFGRGICDREVQLDTQASRMTDGATVAQALASLLVGSYGIGSNRGGIVSQGFMAGEDLAVCPGSARGALLRGR